MTKNTFVALIVITVLTIGAYFFPTGNTVVQKVTERLGAVSTLDGVDSSYVKINGVETAYVSQAINATSTMLCNIQNPYSASSTLLSFSMRVTDGVLGANNVSVSTSSLSYGSSTPVLVLDHVLPSNSTSILAWVPNGATSTRSFTGAFADSRILPSINGTNGGTYNLINSGEFVVARLSTTTGAGDLADYYDGQCSAVFQKI